MIQRIQTVYLALAALLCIACLCLPVARFTDQAGEECATMYNLWIHVPAPIGATITTMASDTPVLAAEAEGAHVFTPWALFALLVLTTTAEILCIFFYRQRLAQSRLALLCSILLIGWYVLYCAFAIVIPGDTGTHFLPTPWAAFPAIACILCYLAFRAILKDEMLVRSLDRLR
jgi:hypothetical protein